MLMRTPFQFSPLSSKPSAVNDENVPIYVVRGARREKHHRPAEVFGVSPSPGLNPLADLPAAHGVGLQRAGVVRGHITRGIAFTVIRLGGHLFGNALVTL